jgi:hypothetical protein
MAGALPGPRNGLMGLLRPCPTHRHKLAALYGVIRDEEVLDRAKHLVVDIVQVVPRTVDRRLASRGDDAIIPDGAFAFLLRGFDHPDRPHFYNTAHGDRIVVEHEHVQRGSRQSP